MRAAVTDSHAQHGRFQCRRWRTDGAAAASPLTEPGGASGSRKRRGREAVIAGLGDGRGSEAEGMEAGMATEAEVAEAEGSISPAVSSSRVGRSGAGGMVWVGRVGR